MAESNVILVSGAAGFIGSHLCRKLCREGYTVLGFDTFHTGLLARIEQLQQEFPQKFRFFKHDVRQDWRTVDSQLRPGEKVGGIFHLACPASPPKYSADPSFTLETSVVGTRLGLECARRFGARFLFTSTSEIYGDPKEHPQRESYRGDVNTWGPRACYDEGKRVGETWCYIYQTQHRADVRVARIFNTYGPDMDPEDGRVMTNFIQSALQGRALEVYGTGKQTRSFCYVDDLVDGLLKLYHSSCDAPVNLGNPNEITVLELAERVRRVARREDLPIIFKELPQDDPQKRRPDITRAMQELQWQPRVTLEDGLKQMCDWMARKLKSRA